MSVKQGCKSLQVLDMSNCQLTSDVGLSSLMTKASGLCQLRLAYSCMEIHSLDSSLQKLSKLQSIILDGCEVTTAGLKTIGNSCIPLRELSLRKCSGVTDEGLSSIVIRHKELAKFDLTCCHYITDVSLASITVSCTSLTTLRMESCILISNEGFHLIGQRCHHLKELDLTDNNLDDEGLIAISGCGQLSVLRIALCLQISDEGLVHVAKYCPNIVELDFYRCTGITDMGVTAIAGGCPRLQSINLGYCTRITDGSLKSLSKCSDLNILGIRGCPLVSSSGLTAIALGCRKLAELDIRKCYSMNDAGMLLLARVSQNLREINLSYCSVTDVGVLALASISCLQIMTIVHVGGFTPHGLATALSACGGLRKVQLHSLFKPLLPRPLLERLAACGCVLQWRDKTLQFGVESSEVWKRKSQEMLAFVVATSDP